MPRSWTEKTKTGCITCRYVLIQERHHKTGRSNFTTRARKVKCDQNKPSCNRCVSTGRVCGGYLAVPVGWYSWDQLLSKTAVPISPKSHIVSEPEARAVEYYQHVAASELSTWFDGPFWNELVIQVSISDAAAKDALIAISTICERQSNRHGNSLMGEDFALQHYNRALHKIGARFTVDINLTLLSCILFICLESLLGNQQAFIAHGDHGIRILNTLPTMNHWTRSHVLPIFIRLDIWHFFMQKRSVPSLTPEVLDCSKNIQGPFTSFPQARHELDKIFSRVVRTIRVSIDDRQRVDPSSDEQKKLQELLRSWKHIYDESYFARTEPRYDRDARSVLHIIYLMSSMWIDVMMDDSEMQYDDHTASFEEIICLSQAASERRFEGAMTGESCNFDVEVLPLLYFAVIKCRRLDLRLKGLKIMESSPVVKENQWDSRIFYTAACHVVEMEHGFEIQKLEGPPPGSIEPPPREKRVRCVHISQNETTFEDGYGRNQAGRNVTTAASDINGHESHVVYWLPSSDKT